MCVSVFASWGSLHNLLSHLCIRPLLTRPRIANSTLGKTLRLSFASRHCFTLGPGLSVSRPTTYLCREPEWSSHRLRQLINDELLLNTCNSGHGIIQLLKLGPCKDGAQLVAPVHILHIVHSHWQQVRIHPASGSLSLTAHSHFFF